MVIKINALNGRERLSTQALLQQIYAAMEKGETDFEIKACGQHDIGGPLWNKEGKKLRFVITDPGQRVGSMCMENTEVVVEGPAPADVGWLNAGGTIIVKGDGGDTTAHCAAAGTIYIGGRAGTRSGSLMKHDPRFEPPQFWVLKNTGSFSFEFMGGGIAVICGHDCTDFSSVLGDRACVGMVGGVIYVRGQIAGVSQEDVRITELSEEDKLFLQKGMPVFLQEIDQKSLQKSLTEWADWKKLTPLTFKEKHSKSIPGIKQFRQKEWVEGGIFSDVYPDEGIVSGLVGVGQERQRYPKWINSQYCAPCEYACPVSIPTQTRYNLIREGKIQEALELVYAYSPFPCSVCGLVCPNMCMDLCTRKQMDEAIDISGIGLVSALKAKPPAVERKEAIAVVGGGVGGLTVAWQLRLRGYQVTVIEQSRDIGGKLAYGVSADRLTRDALNADLDNLKKIGITYKLNTKVDDKLYQKLKKDFDYVVLASGAYQPKLPPWPGKEKLLSSLEFLAKVNYNEPIKLGEKVVVIGAGNTGMDVIFGAYRYGAKQVTAIDVQKPNAFQKEIHHAESLGAVIRWPAVTKEITDKGVILTTGELIEADTVIVAIGEAPILSYITDSYEQNRGYLQTKENFHLSDNVYAIGDMTKLGLLADAIGQGREVALLIDAKLTGKDDYTPRVKDVIARNLLTTNYYDTVHKECVVGKISDVDRCISCGTCRDCRLCKESCPEKAISRVVLDSGKFEYQVDDTKCIGCSICSAACPCGIWQMYTNKADFPGGEA